MHYSALNERIVDMLQQVRSTPGWDSNARSFSIPEGTEAQKRVVEESGATGTGLKKAAGFRQEISVIRIL